MVEVPDADRFPIVVGMALQAILAQSSLVLVLVTGDAGRGYTQKCLIQIFDFNDCALRLGDMFSGVTTIAGQPGVLALEWISRLLVIEGPRIPFDQREILAVMFRVTPCAFLAGVRVQVVRGVQPFS